MFLIKRNKIIVDAFVNSEPIYTLSKLDYAQKYVPQGWKSLPASREFKAVPYQESKANINLPTIKKCPGLSNLFSMGFILPAWTDMVVESMATHEVAAFDPLRQQRTESHPDWAWWPDLYKGYNHTKLTSPWLLREKSGIHFVFKQCDWHHTDRIANFHVLSGIVDYTAQHHTHVNVFVKKDSITNLQMGDPLVHIVPMTEKKVELRTHLIGNAEYNSMTEEGNYMWSGQHRAMYKTMTQSKCPFGFGKK